MSTDLHTLLSHATRRTGVIARPPLVVSIPASPLSISCGKPIARLFAGNLERYYRITASPALGQPIKRVLHHVAQQFHGILPLAACGAMGLGATLIHRETSFLGAWSMLLYSHRFSQLNFTGVREIDARTFGAASSGQEATDQ
jgi:hypothetical protein